ncbi:hypothetical protein DM01DRAFT_1371507 [Hesseltinella vesiculosa]|uniref:Mediator of RNA polymerase II transcription subunit 27 n=1 Tax=Hesseltinella vesiculosa TaxID=101127 RepID=A0A1X2GRL9_9FUNG|nr:hypothetical protein DM01DRAFT_1371507 [Hesseltinella vesiculosa]
MTTAKSQQELEQAISHVDHTLSTFVKIVESNPQQPSYIHQFSDGLNKIKRELNRLSGESESLKGVLEYTHVLAQQNNFDWPAIKEQKPVARQDTSEATFITSVLQQWLASEKLKSIPVQHRLVQPEQKITNGSVCSLELTVRNILTATIDFEHHEPSDSLIIHRYDIKHPKEQKPYWQDSSYNVFQKIHTVASRALDDLTRFAAREALVNVLDWLTSYHQLYQEPCARCQKRLQFDSPQFKYLPPVVRTWDQTIGTAYHLKCFQE